MVSPPPTSEVDTYQSFCDVLGKSLNELLNDCGVENCKYDAEHGWLYILGIPILLSYDGTYTKFWLPFEAYDFSINQKAIDLKLVKGEPYNLSITFTGNPDTAFGISITGNNKNYNTLEDSYHGFELFHLTEQMTGNSVIGVRTRLDYDDIAVFKFNPDGTPEEMNEVEPYFNYDIGSAQGRYLSYIGLITPEAGYTKISKMYSQEKLLLIPWYTVSNIFRVNGCFVYDNTWHTIPDVKQGVDVLHPITVMLNNKKYMICSYDYPFLVEVE